MSLIDRLAEELSRLHALGRDTRNAPTIQAAIQVSLDVLDEACARVEKLADADWLAMALSASSLALVVLKPGK